MRADSRPGALGRPFWALVASSGSSNLADGVFKLALPLVAITYTRSPALVAGLELARTLPWLVGALPVGALTDRIDRRRSMLFANTARAVLAGAAAAAIGAGAGGIWMLYLTAIGTGVAEVFYDTSAQSILPSVVDRSKLDRANGRLYAVELGAQEFVGPPLAGALVGIGLGLSFATSAGMWVVALGVLLTLRGTFRADRVEAPAGIRSDIRQGLSFLAHRPVLRRMAVMVGIANLASSATFAVLVLFAVGPDSAMGLTEPQFGLLFALIATGGVVGGLVAERLQRKLGRATTLTVSLFGMIIWISAPAFTSHVVLIAAAMFIGGLMVMLWNIITVSFRQRATPDHLLGRVNSTYRLVAWGTMPLGAALGGALGEWLGVRSVFAVMGLVAATVLIPNRRITDSAMLEAEGA